MLKKEKSKKQTKLETLRNGEERKIVTSKQGHSQGGGA